MYSFSLNTHKTTEVQTYLLGTIVFNLTMNLLNQAYKLYLNIYYTKAELMLHVYNI